MNISSHWVHFEMIIAADDEYPNRYFIAIDSVGPDLPSNMNCYSTRVHEGSFLVGVIAALSTEIDKIEFIGGMNFDFINQFEIRFIAGAKTVNPSIEIAVAYAGTFED